MAIEYIPLNRNEPVVLGSDIRCISGAVVSTRFASVTQEYEVEYRFHWATWTEVETLLNAWKNATAVTIQGQSVLLNAENGVSNVRHEAWGDDVDPANVASYRTDLWTGELRGTTTTTFTTLTTTTTTGA